MQDVMRALDRIKKGEGLSITKAALRAVAHRSGGSLRDAQKYLDEFVYGVKDRAEYMKKNAGLAERLKAKPQICEGVNYGY